MKTTTKIACAYCRVSTDLEEQKKSIVEQQKQWLEFFEENKITIAEVGCLCHREIIGTKADGTPKKGKLIVESRNDGLFVDEGISGTTLKNRKAFQQMVEDAKLHKFDIIYTEDITRFTRSMEDGLQVIKDLRQIGVGVFFRKENINSLDTSKEFEIQLRISIAQEESRVKSERMKWGMKRLHLAGGWNSVAPYGYDIVKGRLQINESQAEVVRLIYNMYINHHKGIGSICNYLNDSEIPTQKGVQWSQIQIRRILCNQIYTGEMRTHTVETDDITRHTRRAVPESEHIVIPEEKLRILSDDTFHMAQVEQARRAENYSQGNGISTKHLLSTLLYCAYCGGAFKRKKRHTYIRKDGTSKDIGYEWTCGINDMYGERKAKGGKCPGGRNALIEEDVIEAIKYEILQLKRSSLDTSFEWYLAERFKDIREEDIEKLCGQQKDLEGEMRLLRQDRLHEVISEDVYEDSLRQLNEELSAVKATISRIERIQQEKIFLRELYEGYKKTIQEVDVNNLTSATLKNIFQKILVRYRVDESGKKIPYLRFVYKFLDITSDDLLEAQGGETNIKVYTPMYQYKVASMLDQF